MKQPQDTARLAQIAMAIEPLPNKEGLTTRLVDKEDTLKLEYFIIAAINSGDAIRELMWRPQHTPSYDLLVRCVTENHLNRGGLRVNAGQVIMLWPILITLRDYECNSIFDLGENVQKHLKDTRGIDIYNFQIANQFQLSLWEGHEKHRKLIDIEAETLYEYVSKTPEYFEKEIKYGFPSIFKMYKELNQEAAYTDEMERLWAVYKDMNFPDGHIADYMAITVFLAMYFDDYRIR